jgi:hypothetical protein
VIERFGDPDRLLSVRVSLVKYAAFGEGVRQMATSHNGREHQEAEPRTGRLAVERRHPFPADMFRAAIVA